MGLYCDDVHLFQQHFPRYGKDGKVTGSDARAAQELHLARSGRRLWSPTEKARGRGCWSDGDGRLFAIPGLPFASMESGSSPASLAITCWSRARRSCTPPRPPNPPGRSEPRAKSSCFCRPDLAPSDRCAAAAGLDRLRLFWRGADDPASRLDHRPAAHRQVHTARGNQSPARGLVDQRA